jgi:hypothetical protein
MNKVSIFIVLVFFVSVVAAASESGAETISEAPLLRDGFIMNGVDGSLIGPDSNDVWFFKLATDVNDYRTTVKVGTKFELLPSLALEQMIAHRNLHTTSMYRLWSGRVTKYKGRNYIFPNFFLPVSKAKKPPQEKDNPAEAATKPESERDIAIDDPNDVLAMPPEIIEKLKLERSAPSVQRSENGTGSGTQQIARSANSVLVDRTGFLVKRDDGRLIFVPDALGQNVENLTLNLLPCAVLELAELKQAADPERERFKVTGIITKYKGENYLLLEKATRTYSHGNFGK